MPLRDHFRPPLAERRSWEGFLGGWPAILVSGLNEELPARYVAEPRVHLATSAEIEVTARAGEYAVRVYDAEAGQRLVAAVEIVSPSNKDRPEHRRAFVAKCAALVRNHVCVAIVDLVTDRSANFYGDLLEVFGVADQALTSGPPPLVAASCRLFREGDVWPFKSWMHPLVLGQTLPTLPLWLTDKSAVPLELEASYEETCRILRLV